MSQFITPATLQGLNEHELRVLYARILNDLVRSGKSAQDCPHVYATLQNIRAAILRLQQRPQMRRLRGPGF